MKIIKPKKMTGTHILVLSFLGLIVAGTFLLKLPFASHSGTTWIDALFTATSAVCVTGLIVVDTSVHFRSNCDTSPYSAWRNRDNDFCSFSHLYFKSQTATCQQDYNGRLIYAGSYRYQVVKLA